VEQLFDEINEKKIISKYFSSILMGCYKRHTFQDPLICGYRLAVLFFLLSVTLVKCLLLV